MHAHVLPRKQWKTPGMEGMGRVAPLFLGPPSPLAFVPGRESTVVPALPLPLVDMAGMDPARGGLVLWDLGKLRCISAFKMTSF